jgi:hypothetical protein
MPLPVDFSLRPGYAEAGQIPVAVALKPDLREKVIAA